MRQRLAIALPGSCRDLAALGLALLAAACSEVPSSPATRPALPAAAAVAEQPTRRHLVALRGAERADLEARVKSLGGRIERRHQSTGLVEVEGLDDQAAAALAARADVERVVRDVTVQWIRPFTRVEQRRLDTPGPRAQGTDQHGAFFFPLQWNIRVTRADQAWAVSRGGAGRLICILDTGVDPDHIDLAGRVDPQHLVSVISSPVFPGDLDPLDYNAHGTLTAGFITTNGIGVASVAPDARLCSVKVLNVLGSGTFGDVIAGIEYAAETARADVINMSLGAYVNRQDPGIPLLVELVQRAVDVATRHGALVVAAAGNDAINLDDDPASFLAVPAQLRGVVSVAATGPIDQRDFDRLASYSNFGGRTGVDLAAPGGDFVTGNLADLVIGPCSQYQLVLPFACTPVDFVLAAGTSESAPHVAAAAAVVEAELGGQRPPGTLESCLESRADKVGPLRQLGAGRLNVLRAAQCR